MQYSAQDVQLTLPTSDIDDLSMNIIKFPETGVTLVITRGLLAEGLSVAESFDAQITKLRQQTKNFQSQGRRVSKAGVDSDIAAVEIQNQFARGPEKVYQFQLACMLSESRRRMLALSYVKHSPLTEKDREHWESIKTTLKMLSPDEGEQHG